MFESAELGPTLSKARYRKLAAPLRESLLDAQTRLRGANFPVLILINGVEGAGKSETVNLLLEWLDARFIVTQAFAEPTDEENERPPFWRFWRALPPKGRIGILFGNWYTAPILGRALGDLGDNAFDHALERVNHFERLLVDDGALVLKFWFHLTKNAQRRVLDKLRQDPDTAWRVSKRDRKFARRYDEFREASEAAVRTTDTAWAPWHVIDAHDRRHREIAVATTLRDAVSARLSTASEKRAKSVKKPPLPKPTRVNIVRSLDLSGRLPEARYERLLEKWQGRLNRAAREVFRRNRSAVLAFEGVDAAGKGGAIRRITHALDARQYRVIPIAAPTDEERAQPYLWRFWRHLPGRGRVTIFDRTWYGRVLVERIEGFCAAEAWQRAFNEINDFEEQLCSDGIALVKVYMVISAREQLKRFRERETVGYKRYKITEEDWRNRGKFAAYEAAVCDMIAHTSTRQAPWLLVPAEDKLYARVKVLQAVTEAVERGL